jgi:hypothetical protein
MRSTEEGQHRKITCIELWLGLVPGSAADWALGATSLVHKKATSYGYRQGCGAGAAPFWRSRSRNVMLLRLQTLC